MIEQVLSDQEAKRKKFAGKVGTFLGNVYPIAGVVLGIVSFGADVSVSIPRLELIVLI